MTTTDTTTIIPIHQWTHNVGRVWIVKCVNNDGTSHDGFVWPESGPVRPLKCSRAADCDSGGLFGWAWGMRLGEGKEPDYRARWIVFSAPPDQVIEVAGKVKVAADTPDEVDCRVEFCGKWWEAMSMCHAGQMAWIKKVSSATGESGVSSATGWSGASSATGVSGAAVVTGKQSTVEAGPRSVAVATCDELTWVVHVGAVLFQRWVDGDSSPYAVLDSVLLKLMEGQRVRVVKGVIVP